MPKSLSTHALSPPPPRKHKRRADLGAFTLAETLITLAIIGIIAALTVPNLLRNYNERQTITKLKKIRSVMSQAYGSVRSEGNNWLEGNNGSFTSTVASEELANIFKPHLKIAKDCGYEKSCFYDGYYQFLKGGNWFSFFTSPQYRYMVKLADGSSIAFIADRKFYETGTSEMMGGFYYDTNGEKGPNTFGKDLFQFDFAINGNISPSGEILTSNFPTLSKVMEFCYINGSTCQAWIFRYDNMDYLHCQDLSFDGKHSCK